MNKSLGCQALKSLQKCAVVLLTFPLFLSMSSAALAGWCDLQIRNNSQHKIRGIYMSHAGKNHWSDNLLESHAPHHDRKKVDAEYQNDDYHPHSQAYIPQHQHEYMIKQGESVQMRYEYDEKQCYYDMKIVSEHETEGEIHQVNLCKTTAYEISNDDYGGSTQAW